MKLSEKLEKQALFNFNIKLKEITEKADQKLNDLLLFTSNNIKLLGIDINGKEIDKNITEDALDLYLKKRGYTMNYVLGKRVMMKDFTCIYHFGDTLEIWHDKCNSRKSIFINESVLTSLPIVLNYMERI